MVPKALGLAALFFVFTSSAAFARTADHMNDVAHGYILSAGFDHLYLNALKGDPRGWQRIVLPALFTAVAALGLNIRTGERRFHKHRYFRVVGFGLARALLVYRWN